MGDFANGFANKVISIVLSVVVIGINIYFVTNLVMEAHLSSGWMTLIGNISLESLITSINILIFCFDFFPSHSSLCDSVHTLQHIFDHTHECIPRRLAVIYQQLSTELCLERQQLLTRRFL